MAKFWDKARQALSYTPFTGFGLLTGDAPFGGGVPGLGGGGEDPPPYLDPTAAVNAQAAANRYNITGPFGGVTWQRDGAGNWTQQQTPSDAQARAWRQLQDLAQQAPNPAAFRVAVPNIQQPQFQPGFEFVGPSGPRGAYNVDAPTVAQWGGDVSGGVPQWGGRASPLPQAPQLGQVAQWSGQASPMPQAPQAGRVSQFQAGPVSGQDAQRATFERAAAMFRPQFDRQQRALDQKLANAGLPAGSEAFSEQQRDLAEGQSRAMTDAALASVLAGNDQAAREAQLQMAQYQTGLTGQGQQFGQDLAGYQAALAGQGQGFGQSLAGYQAALQGQGQQAQQQLAQYQAALAGQGQAFGQDLSGYQAALQGQGQQFGQNLSGYQAALQGQGQAFGQSLARAGLMFGQDTQAAQLAREREQAAWSMNNQSRQQNFANQLAAAQAMFGMQSQAAAQNFGQGLQGTQTQQAIAAQMLGYMPGLPQSQIDVLGPLYANQNAAMNNYNQQLAQQSAIWGALGNFGGSAVAAGM